MRFNVCYDDVCFNPGLGHALNECDRKLPTTSIDHSKLLNPELRKQGH